MINLRNTAHHCQTQWLSHNNVSFANVSQPMEKNPKHLSFSSQNAAKPTFLHTSDCLECHAIVVGMLTQIVLAD